MNWICLGIVSALLLGVYDVFRKVALRQNAVLPVLWLSTLAAALPFAILVGTGQVPAGGAHVQALILAKSFIVALSWVLEFFAMKHLPISVAVPVRASQPVFTLFGAVAIFGERLTAGRWAGLSLAIFSYFYFAFSGRRDGPRFRINVWMVCAFGAAFIGACSSLYDKFLLNRCRLNPLTVQSWYTLYIAALLSAVIVFMWFPRRARTTRFSWRWSIPCIGLCLAASDALYFHALRDPGALIAMLTTIRRANVVISFACGAFLFGETNLRPKAVALVGILAGVVVMTLS